MARYMRRCSSSVNRILLALALCWPISIGATFAQSYKVDAQSQSLTNYLRQHQLPLVGAQVLTNGSGDRRIVLYGFVATAFGKNDAARKALAFVGNGSPARAVPPEIENRIEIRPEIARMKPRVAPSGAETSPESLDQVLNDIDHYGVTMAPAEPNLR